MKKKPSTLPPAVQTGAFFPPPSHAAIAARAREIWVARGRPFGCDDIIWLQAERELLRSLPASAEAGPAMNLDRAGAVAGPVETSLDLVASPTERRSPTSL